MGMGLTYPPPTFVFFFFLFSFRLSDTSLLGAIADEASKNSIKFAGIWRKSLFLILILGQIYSGIKNSMGLIWRKSLHKVVSRDLGSSLGHLPQQFMTIIVRTRSLWIRSIFLCCSSLCSHLCIISLCCPSPGGTIWKEFHWNGRSCCPCPMASL